MKTALRIFGIFVATLLFLSIEIGDKPIFGHIYKLISPATRDAQKLAESFFDSSVDQTNNYSKKLFENSSPRLRDSVKSKMSSIKNHQGRPQEDLTVQDKNELDALIKSN
jgi:hypothetical protein